MKEQQIYAQAARRYREAAQKGDADAQALLGLMYELGHGVPQDYVKAHMWLDLAASRGTAVLQNSHALVRDRVATRMTPQQIAKAQRLAQEWKPGAKSQE
jgi:TPR repeat protein